VISEESKRVQGMHYCGILRTMLLLFARASLMLFLSLGSMPIPAHAAGVRDIVIPAAAGAPAITAEIWTPCAAPAGPILVESGGVHLTLTGVKDCPSAGKKLPLILISHGLYGDAFSHHDTAEFLADHGFAVVALNHTQDSYANISDKSPDDISSLLVRPVDIRRVIDFLLSDPRTLMDIDPQRIGFFGFSRGGYTGLMLAGAISNFQSLTFSCPEAITMCKQIRENNIPEHGPVYEPRIKAFVIADPLSFFPDRASLKNVKAPIQLWSSERGTVGASPEAVEAIAHDLPNPPEFHRVANAAHMSFLAPCTADEAKTLPSTICTDPPNFDRSAFHETFNTQVLQFFREKLGASVITK
jgi:predicted dienelactone hydrolase